MSVLGHHQLVVVVRRPFDRHAFAQRNQREKGTEQRVGENNGPTVATLDWTASIISAIFSTLNGVQYSSRV